MGMQVVNEGGKCVWGVGSVECIVLGMGCVKLRLVRAEGWVDLRRVRRPADGVKREAVIALHNSLNVRNTVIKYPHRGH